LPEVVPVGDHWGVEALGEDPLVEALALRRRLILNILAQIRVYDVVEEVIVGRRVVVVVGWEGVKELFLFVVDLVNITGNVAEGGCPEDARCAVRIDHLAKGPLVTTVLHVDQEKEALSWVPRY
jgi:hypothetical protein